MVTVSPHKSMFATLTGSFKPDSINDWLAKVLTGNTHNFHDLPKSGMKFKKADKWDGKDAAPIEEEPLDYYDDL